MANIGINVEDYDGKITPGIIPAEIGVGGLQVISERGIPGKPVLIETEEDFYTRFGYFIKDGYGAYCYRAFKRNGGEKMYVMRVVGTGGAVAERNFSDGVNDTIKIKAGYRGDDRDEGAWGNNIAITIKHTSKGTTNPVSNISAGVTEIEVEIVDGFYKGGVIKISEGSNEEYRKVTEIEGNKIKFEQGLVNSYTQSAEVKTIEFDIEVYYKGELKEKWEKLSMEDDVDNYVESVINNEYTGSKYIVVIDLDSASGIGKDIPEEVEKVNLTGGLDGSLPGVQDFINNLSGFDTVEIEMLGNSETSDIEYAKAAEAYCANRGDCMFIAYPPFGYDKESAKIYGKKLRKDKSYGSGYWGWYETDDPIGLGDNPKIWIPPVGGIMGIWVRIAKERGIYKAPAGNQAVLVDAFRVETDITDAEHTDLVENGSINGIREIPDVGIVLDASRTFSTNPVWWYINKRRFINFIKRSLKKSLTWVKQEPNNTKLARNVKYNAILPFLEKFYPEAYRTEDSKGNIYGFDKVVQVEYSIEEQGRLIFIITIDAADPAEKIIIKVGQHSVTES